MFNVTQIVTLNRKEGVKSCDIKPEKIYKAYKFVWYTLSYDIYIKIGNIKIIELWCMNIALYR